LTDTAVSETRQSNDRALGKWLIDRGLLHADELQDYTRNLRLPADFPNRVLDRHGHAQPAPSIENVTSHVIVPTDPSTQVEPARLTYSGPCPRELATPPATHMPATLYEARVGKVFVGREQTTLILDKDHYFAGVSTPASQWIAPAFAEAPGETKLSGTAAILFADGATLFSHWMFDLLPKVEVLRRAGWTPDRIDYYVVNALRTNFQVETLEALGISSQKVIVAGGRVVSADRLLIPSRIRSGLRTPPWVRRFVNETFAPRDARDRRPDTATLRLHISRADARRRRVLNEDVVREILERKGFQTVFAERHSVAGFADLISRAEQIVAPHGAGVMNVAFAQPHVRLLEAYGAHISSEGWLMTDVAGGCHFLLAGKDEQGRYPWQNGAYEGLSRIERNAADFIIDPRDLDKALDMLAVPQT
jgi:capsular polysaccharide biosynthesis protein